MIRKLTYKYETTGSQEEIPKRKISSNTASDANRRAAVVPRRLPSPQIDGAGFHPADKEYYCKLATHESSRLRMNRVSSQRRKCNEKSTGDLVRGALPIELGACGWNRFLGTKGLYGTKRERESAWEHLSTIEVPLVPRTAMKV